MCTTGEFGFRRGADDDDDEDDKPSRAKSMLKLLSRERGGKGEELFRLLAWKLDAKVSTVGLAPACGRKTAGSVIARWLL